MKTKSRFSVPILIAFITLSSLIAVLVSARPVAGTTHRQLGCPHAK